MLVTLLISVFILSCKKDDKTSKPENLNFTVYQNQSDDLNADALQAQYIAPNNDHVINFYGLFDENKNPTTINTVTYQKANNDTIVNMTINPITNKINSLFFTVNGVKSNIVMKFEYINDTNLEISFYQYDWNNNTSENIYSVKISKTGLATKNAFYSRLMGGNDIAYNLSALGLGMAAAEITAAIGGGWSAIGTIYGVTAGLVAGVSATAIVGAAAIAATLIFTDALFASTIPESVSITPTNTELYNPIPPAKDPTPNLQQTSCFNNNITFEGTMDSVGNIMISAVTGGSGPYSYLVGSQLQKNPVFANQYADGSYLLGVKDANGCMSVKIIPLDRVLDDLIYSIDTLALLRSKTWVLTNASILNVEGFSCGGDPEVHHSVLQSAVLTFGGSNSYLTYSSALTGIVITYTGKTPCWSGSKGTVTYGGNVGLTLPGVYFNSGPSTINMRPLWNSTIISVDKTYLVLASNQYTGQLTFIAK